MYIIYIVQLLLCHILLIICIDFDFAECLSLRIEPNETVIVKYVGDSANLTCFLDGHRPNASLPNGNFLANELTSSQTHTFNWIIPNNCEERVVISESRSEVTIHIKDLKETDHGNYTCHLLSDADSTVSSKKAFVYLAVLPRGHVSFCNENSFFCEKSLCIPSRYKCDGHPDCPDGVDESYANCGSDACYKKLPCDDGRCLAPEYCCRETTKAPPNCTVHANIQCCRQLIHPALIDQDLYYLASRPKMKQIWHQHSGSTLLVGGIVVFTSLITVGLIMGVRFQFCRRDRSCSAANWYRLFPWNILAERRLGALNPTDQYLLQSASNSYFDRSELGHLVHGMRASSLTAADVLRCQQRDNLVLVSVPQTLTDSSQPTTDCGPPPSYNQVIGGPPPPYSCPSENSETNSVMCNRSLLVPLLTGSSHQALPNISNGYLNENTEVQLSMACSRNYPLITADARSSSRSSSEVRPESSSSRSTGHSFSSISSTPPYNGYLNS